MNFPRWARVHPVKNTLVYLNPSAGSGRSGGVWARLQAEIPQLRAARLICDQDRDVALAQLRRRLGEEAAPQRLLVVGGDGTLHRVAHEVLEAGLGQEIPVGLVPSGTGSDLARSLGVPRDPLEALQRVLSSSPRPMDVLRLESPGGKVRFSINVAAAGIAGVVDQAVNARSRRTAAVYVLETLKAAMRFRSVACRVTVDGAPWLEGEVFLLALANGRFFGRGMKIAPRAQVGDGKMDVVAVGPIPRWQLPWRMGQVFLGSHLEAAPVRWCRAQSVRLQLPDGAPPLDLDGESFECRSARISVLPAALRLHY